MRQTIRICISIIFFALYHFTLKAQIFFPPLSCIVDASGTCIPNPILTAVPYLKLSTDAALSGMGESSILVSPSANTIYSNAALMTNAKSNTSLAVNFIGINIRDDFNSSVLVGISGFHKFSKNNALGIGIRYLDIKNHEYTDATGQSLGINKPNDFDLTIAYAKQINSKFSASISSRYIASNVLTGFVLNGIEIQTAHTFAFDLGLSYKTGIKLAGYDGKIIYGLAATNLGKAVMYFDPDELPTPLPANLNLGTAIELDMGDANKLSISANLNKLMVPSHTTDDLNFNNIPDHRERSYLEGLFGSFADAEGGLKEELSEISGGLGVEFWYINRLAFRSGYHYEHRLKGNNNFYTFGLGVKYKSTSINLAYNAPISQNTQFNRSKYAISMLYDINGDDEN